MSGVVVCGICGGTGSGKTTLVRGLVEVWGHDEVALVAFDSYYHDLAHLDPVERGRINYDHPDSLDVALFVEHLDALRRGAAVEVPHYDFATHTRPGQTDMVESRTLVLVDGILLLAFPEVRARLDHTVFLDVDDGIRFERRLRRDTLERGRTLESVHTQWATSVEPMHRQYVAPSAVHADVVVDHFDELNQVEVVDGVAERIRSRVAATHAV